MAATATSWKQWPALAGMPARRFAALRCERGVWGRAEGAAAGFHWVAGTPGFGGKAAALERSLYLGSEDRPRGVLLWRSSAALHHAVHCYPSRSEERGQRFLEKQVLEWKRPDGEPAALGALVLLVQAARSDDRVWRGREPDAGGFARDYHVALSAVEGDELPVDELSLQLTIQAGCRELRAAVSADALAGLYARLLADGRAISLEGLAEPLSPAAFAALLLPLPRERSDRIDMASWLPSEHAQGERLVELWDLILGEDHVPDTLLRDAARPDVEQRRRGERMAEALLAADPALLTAGAIPRRLRPRPGAAADVRKLVLWGPNRAGKTAFLGQLSLQLEHAGDSDWKILPGPDSVAIFSDLRGKMQFQNRFPLATVLTGERVVHCRLINRVSGEEVLVELEDRPGEDFEQQIDAVHDRLGSADGLVLLFDPTVDLGRQLLAFTEALDRMSATNPREGGRDGRPVAFCLTKADAFIHTAEDYRRALEAPEDFVRGLVDREVLLALDHHFSNVRLFPSSAAGVWAKYGGVEPAVFFDETLTPRLSRQARPLHLIDPLAWVIEQLPR
jgi:hypothetical protein